MVTWGAVVKELWLSRPEMGTFQVRVARQGHVNSCACLCASTGKPMDLHDFDSAHSRKKKLRPVTGRSHSLRNHLLQHTLPSPAARYHITPACKIRFRVIWFPITVRYRSELLVSFGSDSSEVIFSIPVLASVFHPHRLALPFQKRILSSSMPL